MTALTAWLNEPMYSGKMLELFDEVRCILVNLSDLIRFLFFLEIFKDESFNSLVVLEGLENIDHVCELVKSAVCEGLTNQGTIVVIALQFCDCLFDHVQPIDEFIFE